MTSTRTKSYLRSLAALVALVAAIAALLLLAYDADPAHAAGRCSVTPSTTTCTFDTGTSTWTVPDGVTEATFDLFGAQGGGVRSDPGGLGGEATATIPVTPGEPLQVNVGGQGGTPNCCDGGAGGFNGGGAGGQGPCCNRDGGAGGGGASDVRRDTNALDGFALDERIVVAGGGGGIGGAPCCGYGAGGAGGTGGGASGTAGCCSNATDRYNVGGGGGGGSDVAGGSGGTGTYGLPDAGPGVLGIGGTGGGASTNKNGGGGGGGGYYGGGGGGGGKYTGGGGGGSGFGPDDVVFKSGVREGNGLVTITYATPPDTTAPTLSVSHTPDGTNGWNKTSPVTLNVSASDSGSGLAGAPTCTDGTTSLTLRAGSTDGTWTAPVSGDGTHNISCSVSDIFDNSSGPKTDTVKIDATAPSTSCSVTPTKLSTAANNHKLLNITASVQVTDTTGGSGANGLTLVSVTSNQADSGLARDDVAGDIQGWALGTDDKSGQLRAERYGGTRTYTLTYRGYDVAGNAKDCSATVTVPKGK